jgi:transposase
MDPKDLLKMLNLDGEPPDAPTDSGVATAAPAGPAPPADASPTALAVDAWGLGRGRDLVAESDRLKEASTDPFAAADFFAAAFDPDPRLVESCADRRRHQFVAQLLDTPEYHAPHASGDVVMDNSACHKRAGVRAAITAAGCALRLLPAYSPDLDPIERAFGKLKARLRAAVKRTVEEYLGELSAAFAPAECRNYFHRCGYTAAAPTREPL